MIAKTSIGSSFSGAIHYGAGYTVEGKEIMGKADLLVTHNVVSRDPEGIAAEMQQEASYSRCKTPVWHSSISWKPEEKPTREQMIETANRYCQKMGADPKDHQIAVYEHHDKPHQHIHVYINRVPTDGSKALETSHNYARNVRICKEITQELGFSKLEKLEEGKLRHVAVNQEEAQKAVNMAIKAALKEESDTPEDMERRLKEKGIECKYKIEEGRLKYSSYSYQGVPIKGQDVGFTAKQLQARLDKNLEVKKEQSQQVKPEPEHKQKRNPRMGF
ncbi:relaxase/mobilization nuclease domain-containing protein [Dyadobacter alkalitolerans]|uniref:relaxase/mobilization nuclease domain-containing protein n=1 Tax=Dyadobacter alkalitolerans TaxID=492736 RepID=UPI00041D350F|nr:relaxase/mobilization nuclease domain-containing protein [Dyadobacter alkalitolerans]